LSPEPVRAHARRNRERLVAAAHEAFGRDGPDASLEAIARAAGVGIGTLYRHFPSRQALILASYQREVDQLVSAASELLDSEPPAVALRTWMHRLAQYAATKAGLAEALRSVAAAHTAQLPGTYDEILAALATLLEAGVADGAIRSDMNALDVLLAMGGLFHLPPDRPWRPQATRLIDLLMDGLTQLA
jgi:AcrR family transcriptional regulator